ncbi:MAG: EAL domain-containing protein [Betaproteobacteria bacterium]|nr:EAL domain-containing protein [Betaproteobacteria bacterium]
MMTNLEPRRTIFFPGRHDPLPKTERPRDLEAFPAPDHVSIPTITEMVGAIDAAKLTVHYQPQIDLSSGAIQSVEALIRWDDDRHGMLYPAEFLPFAMESGFASAFTDFVLGRLLSQLVLWRRFNFQFGGTLNVPAAVMSTPNFVDHLHRQVARMGLRSEDLIIEITEGVATCDDIVVLENLLELCQKGFGVSMDAFGTDVAAPTKLERLPLTQVKTDRSLMVEAASRPHLRSALQAGAAGAKQHGLKITAIGVERDQEWQLLPQLGFDGAQGHYIAPPMVAEALPDWVTH